MSTVIERAARRYCKVKKLDPDQQVRAHPKALRWEVVAEEMKDQWLRLTLINEEIGEARARQEVKDFNAAMNTTMGDGT